MPHLQVASTRRTRTHKKLMRRTAPAPVEEIPGLRERKKARLRQQIIDTAIRLFRKQGYEKTRVDDIVRILEISQPTFFRYFPSKDAVLRDVGQRGFECITERLKSELSTKANADDLKSLGGDACDAFIIHWPAKLRTIARCGRLWFCRAQWMRCVLRKCGERSALWRVCCARFWRKGRSAERLPKHFRWFIWPSSWKPSTTL